jgi:hypothetical protein
MTNSTMLPGGQRDERSRAGGGGGFARSVAGSAARGAALILLAVVIGIVLLQVIDDGTDGPIGDGDVNAGGTTATTAAPADGSSTTTTTTGAPPREPAQVAVLVLNGSGRQGAATAQTNALRGEGYQTLTPADADQRQGNIVYFKSGFDRECTTIAQVVGGAPTVEPMPDPPPTGSENANCVVVLGT